ncbi:MAG: type II toxin-antitoxin system HipA family toxin, partial [Terriglobales bacterium]
MTEAVEVWLDADFLEHTRVGTLSHDRGTLRFTYEPAWLKDPQSFALDPELSLGEGSYFPNAEQSNFRVFEDSAPDRWGQTLMKRREALAAKDEGRPPRTLYAWDFLLGVEDLTRQGALRFRYPGEESFLAHESRRVPPVASLRELEVVAGEITAKRIDDLEALRKWLAVLVAPGASLGGARPKANFCETDGAFWIAKFPARDDTRDIGAWEAVSQKLARQADIDVPASKLQRFR